MSYICCILVVLHSVCKKWKMYVWWDCTAVLLYAQELCKFLALRVAKMTEELTGQMMEEEEEREKLKIPQQIKNNTALPKQTQDSPDLKMSVIKQGRWWQNRESEHVKCWTTFKALLLPWKVCLLQCSRMISPLSLEPMKRDRQDLISTEFKRALLEVNDLKGPVLMAKAQWPPLHRRCGRLQVHLPFWFCTLDAVMLNVKGLGAAECRSEKTVS